MKTLWIKRKGKQLSTGKQFPFFSFIDSVLFSFQKYWQWSKIEIMASILWNYNPEASEPDWWTYNYMKQRELMVLGGRLSDEPNVHWDFRKNCLWSNSWVEIRMMNPSLGHSSKGSISDREESTSFWGKQHGPFEEQRPVGQSWRVRWRVAWDEVKR